MLAADEPFLGPANWGGTGLMEIPTARVMKENTYRLGAAQVYPYRYYYGALGILPGLEIDGRITEIIGIRAFETARMAGIRIKRLISSTAFSPRASTARPLP